MPKIIPDIREKILDAAEKILKTEGYLAFSIRRLSADCGVAVGTIYNYFREKNEIVAYVILQSWKETLDNIDTAIASEQDFTTGMIIIYEKLMEFIDKNRGIWQQFSDQGGSSAFIAAHHRQLRKQIALRIHALLDRTDNADLAPCIPLLSELILSASMQEDISAEQTRILLKRIVQK